MNQLKFMKNVLPFILAVFLFLGGMPIKSMGQDSRKATGQDFSRNSVYVELFGQGLYYSLNYDRRFTKHIGGRIGFAAYSFIFDTRVIFVPVMANYLIGSGNHHLELGLGVEFLLFSGESESDDYDFLANGIVGTATIGYRYQPVDGGFLFRIGFTPIFYFGGDEGGGFQPWGGASIGYSF